MEFYVRKVEEKLALLKTLQFEVSQGPISETALESMERIEQVSDVLRRTYWAVAVELMLSRIGGQDRELELLGYEMSRMVERVRQGRMELGSELLADWRELCGTKVWNDDVREGILRRYEGSSARECVMMW